MEVNSDKAIVLYDGVCHLCDTTVQYLIKFDKKDKLRFASQQSEIGEAILRKFNRPATRNDTVVLVYKDKVYERSSAFLKTAIVLGFPYSILSLFYIFPRPIRDGVYNFIANNRYQWFGKYSACKVPAEKDKQKFLQ